MARGPNATAGCPVRSPDPGDGFTPDDLARTGRLAHPPPVTTTDPRISPTTAVAIGATPPARGVGRSRPFTSAPRTDVDSP
jgi:hypothetical protein